jgi:hypothetical protein
MKKQYMIEQMEGHSKILEKEDFVSCEKDEETDYSNSGNSTCSEDVESEQLVPNGSEENNDSSQELEIDQGSLDSNDTDEEQGIRSSMALIKIPSTSIGSKRCCSSKDHYRRTRIECSICLLDFQVGDHISWSSLECPHVFHRDCILKWMFTLGEQNDARRIRRLQKLSTVCDFDIPCPVCRMDFIPSKAKAMTNSSQDD